MFEKSVLFLKALKANNNREWYHANKDLYQEAKMEFEHITEILIHECSKFDISVAGLTPKDCIFRIFRDVRFSKDKSPYKTNFGAFIVPGGRKSMHAGYYLHIEPGASSFVAAGIYMPPNDILRSIRNDIFTYPDEFLKILREPKLATHFGEISGEKLKSAPRGFPADFSAVEYLKFKSYGLLSSKTDREITDADSLKTIVDLFKVALPFIRFLNEAIKNGV